MNKFKVFKKINDYKWRYLTEDEGRAVLYPKKGVPYDDFLKHLKGSKLKESINTEETQEDIKEFLSYPEYLRVLEEEDFIKIENKRIFIKSKGLEYLEHPWSFRFRNHWIFPFVSSLLISLISVLIGWLISSL